MGDDVDASADIYALGCSLYHMCSGNPPFRKGGSDDHYTAVVRRHLKSERPQLKNVLPKFDEALSDLCRRMMSRRLDVRPNYAELVDALGDVVGRLGGRLPPRHVDPETGLSHTTGPLSVVEEAVESGVTDAPEVRPRAGVSMVQLMMIVAGVLVAGVLIGLTLAGS